MRTRLLAIWLVAVAAGTAAGQQGAPAQPAVARPMNIWDAQQHVGFIESLLDLGVVPQQLRPAVPALQAYAQAEQARWQALHDPARVAAYRALLDKLIAGQALTDEDWSKARQGQQPLDELEKQARQALQAAGKAVVQALQPYQVAKLGAPEQRTTAEYVVRQLRDARASPPDTWKEWLAARTGELAKRFAPKAADQMAQQLTAFFNEVRNMPTDEFYAKEVQLAERLTLIFFGGQPEPAEKTVQRAQQRVEGALRAYGLAEVLVRWAQEGVAPGTVGAGGGQGGE